MGFVPSFSFFFLGEMRDLDLSLTRGKDMPQVGLWLHAMFHGVAIMLSTPFWSPGPCQATAAEETTPLFFFSQSFQSLERTTFPPTCLVFGTILTGAFTLVITSYPSPGYILIPANPQTPNLDSFDIDVVIQSDLEVARYFSLYLPNLFFIHQKKKKLRAHVSGRLHSYIYFSSYILFTVNCINFKIGIFFLLFPFLLSTLHFHYI